MKSIVYNSLFAISLLATVNVAQAKIATCKISDNYEGTLYHGKCDFQSEKGGSFTISHPSKATIVENVSSISVDMVQKGVAEVRGLTTDGINSRWGSAKRSGSDTACWVGSDFKICAW